MEESKCCCWLSNISEKMSCLSNCNVKLGGNEIEVIGDFKGSTEMLASGEQLYFAFLFLY